MNHRHSVNRAALAAVRDPGRGAAVIIKTRATREAWTPRMASVVVLAAVTLTSSAAAIPFTKHAPSVAPGLTCPGHCLPAAAQAQFDATQEIVAGARRRFADGSYLEKVRETFALSGNVAPA